MTDSDNDFFKRLLAGKFADLPAILQAIAEMNRERIQALVDKFYQLPEKQRKMLSITARLLITLLESHLKKGPPPT